MREISREEADCTLDAPESIAPGRAPRLIYQRRYRDGVLGANMLLRIVVEETAVERVVITLYKTSKLSKYE